VGRGIKQKGSEVAILFSNRPLAWIGSEFQWNNETAHRPTHVGELNVPRDHGVPILVGLVAQHGATSITVDTEFWVVLHCGDASGRTWSTREYHYALTR
jgi:hypothetical protein